MTIKIIGKEPALKRMKKALDRSGSKSSRVTKSRTDGSYFLYVTVGDNAADSLAAAVASVASVFTEKK